MPEYEIHFIQTASFEDPLVVGDAVRWLGPGLWRVEAVEGRGVSVRPWPRAEPEPARIRGLGPGEWPHDP
jgi:hypothetical protein